jgi:tetratricopeptide (TPR) repeat protein
MTDSLRHLRPRPLAVVLAVACLCAGASQVARGDDKVLPAGHPPIDKSAAPGEAASGLTADLMYRLLIGDIALQRGEPALAARAYLESAREARDVGLARRATEIGIATRQRALAVEAAKLWSELDPAAERPKQIVAAAGRGATGADLADSEFKSQIERALAQSASSPQALAEAFLQINHLLGQESDKAAIYKLVVAVAEPYPNVPEAHFATALAAYNTGLKDVGTMAAAMRAIDHALALKPAWERGILLKAEILSKQSPAEATRYLESALAADPDMRGVASSLAQLYVEQKRYADARAVFLRLYEKHPASREFQFGAAALSVQMKDWAKAEALLTELKGANYGENGVVELYLAQVAEETGRNDLAIERYRAVPEGERAWHARLRIASLMGKQNRVAEARQYLAALPAVTIEQRVQVRQAEAQLLRDGGDVPGAYAVLTAALIEFPDEPDLLYDTAMVAEKLDKLDVAEARLKRLLEINPESSAALNALGYTLVDRTTRIAEGYELIEKAHKLSPEDPFILDSMGWALFRMGNLDGAETYLRRALAERPDAEIAAHLGEVLWAKGKRADAQEVWQSALKATPDNAVLLETLRRLAP